MDAVEITDKPHPLNLSEVKMPANETANQGNSIDYIRAMATARILAQEKAAKKNSEEAKEKEDLEGGLRNRLGNCYATGKNTVDDIGAKTDDSIYKIRARLDNPFNQFRCDIHDYYRRLKEGICDLFRPKVNEAYS